MKGIILAGGTGTRLHPLTLALSKQLMPVFDKPMIYYPLSVLMSAGINEILIITTEHDQSMFERLLGDGSHLGCIFSYAVQTEPKGIAEAFIIGEEFIGADPVVLILGDNIFHGSGMTEKLRNLHAEWTGSRMFSPASGAAVFAYHVSDPERYGVVEFSGNKVISIEEKPLEPKSNYAIPGLYFYDNTVIEKAKNLKPSNRGELEITDINKAYLEKENLYVTVLERGTAWLDTGTFDSLMQASQFVQVIEERQGQKIGCIEEVAYRSGFITGNDVKELAAPLIKSGYGKYLIEVVDSYEKN
jgi:glucose-1-phosphate thymidylyltransferase